LGAFVALDHRDYTSLNVVMDVPVREFKAKLSRYIRRAREGKDVVITSRGIAIARLIPAAEQAPRAKGATKSCSGA
jgi:prevent-host-death family protein